MAGQPAAPATPPPSRDRAAPNVVARISQWADDHLRLVRVLQAGRWGARAAQRRADGDASWGRPGQRRRAAGSGQRVRGRGGRAAWRGCLGPTAALTALGPGMPPRGSRSPARAATGAIGAVGEGRAV